MPTPDFVLDLRRAIGHAPLWLMGTTAVVVREDSVLLGRRTDNGALTPMVQCLLDTKDVSRAELDELKKIIAAHESGTTGGKASGKKGRA